MWIGLYVFLLNLAQFNNYEHQISVTVKVFKFKCYLISLQELIYEY